MTTAVEEGERIRAGELLAKLGDFEAAIKARLAQTELEQTQMELAICQYELQAAKPESQSAKAASETKSGHANREGHQANAEVRASDAGEAMATMAIQKAKTRYSIVEATVRAAQCRLELAHLHLEHTNIHAPFDGVVLRTRVSEGEVVDYATPIVELISEQRCVEFDISPAELRATHGDPEQSPKETQPAKVEVEVLCLGKRYQGHVGFVVPEVDRSTQKLTVKCHLEGGTELALGTKVVVRIPRR
jgi:multidrug efflux pump subunit AcrA (membrane-fusion protein)